jgi:DNA-binding HxlR family transcriptional regulator
VSTEPKRAYRQFCPVAKALDLVGDRWTLLIARDLIMGPKRYTDLRKGLPGIATDILAARLRALEAGGFVRRRELPPPTPATVYELTDRGWSLARVVEALGRFGLPYVGDLPAGIDAPVERLVLALIPSFRPEAVPRLEETYELEVAGESFRVAVRSGTAQVSRGPAQDAALRLRTDAVTLVRLLRQEISPSEALGADKLEAEGPDRALERFFAAFAWPASRDLVPAA